MEKTGDAIKEQSSGLRRTPSDRLWYKMLRLASSASQPFNNKQMKAHGPGHFPTATYKMGAVSGKRYKGEALSD